MNSSAVPQIIGNVCIGLAALAFLLPLQKLLTEYAGKHVNDDQWVNPSLLALVPLWLALITAMLCVTVSGGFDWLRLGRPALHVLTVAATASLAALTFLFVAMYIRPGFTPRGLYVPGIYLVPLSTLLLAVVSLNPKLGSAVPIQWLRLPWTIVATLSLVICVGFLGTWIARTGVGGIAGIAHRLRNPGPSAQETLSQIATLDPDTHFDDLLRHATRHSPRPICEAATARLRSHPHFLDRLASELESGHVEPAMEFLSHATLTSAEQARLARPARRAMERWVNRIPAPNYTTRKHLKELRNWGERMLKTLPEKFATTGVDFAPVLEDFQDKVAPSK
jgi:hypothetical protein